MRGALSIAQSRVNAISELTTSVQEQLIVIANTDNSESETRILRDDLENLMKQVETIIENSGFNSANLLSSGSKDVAVTATVDGDSLVIESQGSVGTAAAELQQAITGGKISDPLAVLQNEFQTFETALSEANSSLGTADRAISLREGGIRNFEQVVIENLGNIVESEIARDVVRSVASSIQTQLSNQALSIANGAGSSIIKLFK